MRRRERRLAGRRGWVLREVIQIRAVASLDLVIRVQAHEPKDAIAEALPGRSRRFGVGRVRVEPQSRVGEAAPTSARLLDELVDLGSAGKKSALFTVGADEHVHGVLAPGGERDRRADFYHFLQTID